jgi:7-cyano-7-deazaguanine synthase
MGEVLLFSGGVDSSCLAALRRPSRLLFVDYGHVAAQGERRATAQIAGRLDLPLATMSVDLSALGAGTLAGTDAHPLGTHPEWWPFRNQLLVSLAAAWAVKNGCDVVSTASVVTDDRHVDGTAAFYERIDAVVSMQEGGVRVLAPAVGMRAEELVSASGIDDVTLSFTHSCQTGSIACGSCGGCVKRDAVLAMTGRLRDN